MTVHLAWYAAVPMGLGGIGLPGPYPNESAALPSTGNAGLLLDSGAAFPQLWAGLIGLSAETVVWSSSWVPLVSDASPNITHPDGRQDIIQAMPPNLNYSKGTLTISATVDGVETEVLTMVFSPGGLYGDVAWSTTTVIPPTVVDFTGFPLSGFAPLNVNFTDLTSPTPDSWVWTFGDGGTSTDQNPTYSYAAAGLYSVTLVATVGGIEQAPVTKTDYVLVRGVDFVGTPRDGVRPLTVDFTDLSSPVPTEWLWDFGDGSTSTDQNPTHVYEDTGSYTVSLQAGFTP